MPWVTNLTNTKLMQKPEKRMKPWQMGTHLRVLSECYTMNTNMAGIFASLFFLDESSLSIGRVDTDEGVGFSHLAIVLLSVSWY